MLIGEGQNPLFDRKDIVVNKIPQFHDGLPLTLENNNRKSIFIRDKFGSTDEEEETHSIKDTSEIETSSGNEKLSNNTENQIKIGEDSVIKNNFLEKRGSITKSLSEPGYKRTRSYSSSPEKWNKPKKYKVNKKQHYKQQKRNNKYSRTVQSPIFYKKSACPKKNDIPCISKKESYLNSDIDYKNIKSYFSKIRNEKNRSHQTNLMNSSSSSHFESSSSSDSSSDFDSGLKSFSGLKKYVNKILNDHKRSTSVTSDSSDDLYTNTKYKSRSRKKPTRRYKNYEKDFYENYENYYAAYNMQMKYIRYHTAMNAIYTLIEVINDVQSEYELQ